jgi:hypothetical protein
MTAKEKILELIKLRISYIETYCIKNDAFMNIPVATKDVADELQQLQKLKQIIEGLEEVDIKSDNLNTFTASFNFAAANEGFKIGQKNIINKLNTEL